MNRNSKDESFHSATPLPWVTAHAWERAAQRSVTNEAMHIVYWEGDVELPAGGGCRSSRLSARKAEKLLGEGFHSSAVDEARRVELIVAADGMVVTCIKVAPARASRVSIRRRRRIRLRRRHTSFVWSLS